MPQKLDLTNGARDGLVAAGLVSAPAWAPPLADINALLTTVSLLLGVVLGAARLWLFLKRRRSKDL